jgi:hypothetical protein
MGHRQIAKTLPNNAPTGVLLAEVKTMTMDEAEPTTARSLALPDFHNQRNSGKVVAPKHPAIIEC